MQWLEMASRVVKFTIEDSAAEEISNGERQAIATGSDRRLAIAVIVPRILGPIQFYGSPSYLYEEAIFVGRNKFSILASLLQSKLICQVRCENMTVFTVDMYLDTEGSLFDHMHARTWLRTGELRTWPHEFFETFCEDCYELLGASPPDRSALVRQLFEKILQEGAKAGQGHS